jgi:hypothetical protein
MVPSPIPFSMTTTLTARFDGKVLIPTAPADLPTGTILRLRVELPADAARPLASLAEMVKSLPPTVGPPTDGAAQHDHYLYGAPKRP